MNYRDPKQFEARFAEVYKLAEILDVKVAHSVSYSENLVRVTVWNKDGTTKIMRNNMRLIYGQVLDYLAESA
jgi:hypothetical protein